MKEFELSGKVAVVTGAGGALCGTLSKALGEASVKVAVLDLNMAKASATAEAPDMDYLDIPAFLRRQAD